MTDLFYSAEAIKLPEGGISLATVGTVSSDGVTLIFDGVSSATSKAYKHLSSYSPTAGDRVLIVKLSGSYVVLGNIS